MITGRALRLLPPLILLLALTLLAALLLGSVPVSIDDLWRWLTRAPGDATSGLILDLRWPRILGAVAVGGLLALAGVLIQVLLRNPLGDPYVLGVSGGAATASLLVLLLDLGSVWQTPAGWLGALVALLLVFGLARDERVWSHSRLLLSGVVLASAWAALISFLLAIAPAGRLPGMVYWLMGDLATLHEPWLPLLILLPATLFGLALAPALNLLARGDAQAAALGVEVGRLRRLVLALAALLTAAAVGSAGTIGFIGLVVPHLARLAGAHDHRLLVPSAVLIGATLLLAADTVARTALAPQQLPVGVITALLGAPLFLYLLNRGRRAGR